MATTNAERVLLDTSLLIAASVEAHPANQSARAFVAQLKADQTPTCITPQICREFLATLTRQPASGTTFTPAAAMRALEEWTSISTMLEEGEETIHELLKLIEEHQVRSKQVHDCNLVAVAVRNGVTRLATRNAADFKRFDAEISVEPVFS